MIETTPLTPCPGSFRDSAGVVYDDNVTVVRTIEAEFASQWDAVVKSGFLADAINKALLIEYEEIPPVLGAWKSLRSPKLPFISYPYEWSFGQLKAAALHTLDVLDAALKHGLVLRDATAYNIQFRGAMPLFIDLLSFEPHIAGTPWKAYLQFCRHFLAPLALMAKRSVQYGRLLSNYVEGLPLRLAADALPWSTKLSPTLGIHLHLHARLQDKYSDARKSAKRLKESKFSDNSIEKLSQSLRLAVESLKLPHKLTSEWGDYYNDTNYSPEAAEDKKLFLQTAVKKYTKNKILALDIGANIAFYSEFLADIFDYVIALDIDYLAIEKLFNQLQSNQNSTILPLVMDICNPSPSIGWCNEERTAFLHRCKVDYLSALAVIHHLFFTGGIPLPRIAQCFAGLVKEEGLAVVEFVPLEDSQVQRLLAVRGGDWPAYTLAICLQAFMPYFDVLEQHAIADSQRTLLLFKKKAA